MKPITVYKCDHCGKIYRRKWSCEQHEPKCFYNPATRSCASCQLRTTEYVQDLASGCFQKCYKNHDIQTRLNTNCFDYVEQGTFELTDDILQKIINRCDIQTQLNRAYERFGKVIPPDMSEVKLPEGYDTELLNFINELQ
jgi:hypothetical protein